MALVEGAVLVPEEVVMAGALVEAAEAMAGALVSVIELEGGGLEASLLSELLLQPTSARGAAARTRAARRV